MLTVFDAVDVGIELVNGPHAVLEVTVAHVSVDGCLRPCHRGGEQERLHSPRQVLCASKREPKNNATLQIFK